MPLTETVLLDDMRSQLEQAAKNAGRSEFRALVDMLTDQLDSICYDIECGNYHDDDMRQVLIEQLLGSLDMVPDDLLFLSDLVAKCSGISTKSFTVVGIYPDTGERFCDSIDAEDAASAEQAICIKHPDLEIAGVFRYGTCLA